MSWPFRVRGSREFSSNDARGVRLGRRWHGKKNRAGERLIYSGEKNLLLAGQIGSGKGVRVILTNLLQITGKSIVVIDPKAENAAVSAEWRRTVSDVVVLNPFGTLTEYYPDLQSAGFNPLAALSPDDRGFIDAVMRLAEALIRNEGSQPFFPLAARKLVKALIITVKLCDGDAANIADICPMVRSPAALIEACEALKALPVEGKSDLWRIARETALGDLRRFIDDKQNGSDTISSVLQEAESQLDWMSSPVMHEDLGKDGIDLRQLKERATSLYLCLPAAELGPKSTWLRLVISSAINACWGVGGVPVLFLLDEFASLGHLEPVATALSQARGSGVALFPVLQSLTQLQQTYDKLWENFVGQAGAVIGFRPNDLTTAKWMSERSGETTVVVPNIGDNATLSGGSKNRGWSITKRPYLQPQDLFNIREGFAYVWPATSNNPIPAYVPPYYDIAECARRARPNPYFRSAKPRRNWSLWSWVRSLVRARRRRVA